MGLADADIQNDILVDKINILVSLDNASNSEGTIDGFTYVKLRTWK